jgi:hypothetical protein
MVYECKVCGNIKTEENHYWHKWLDGENTEIFSANRNHQIQKTFCSDRCRETFDIYSIAYAKMLEDDRKKLEEEIANNQNRTFL